MCMYVDLITDVVNEFAKEDMMFTAHNVTTEVRKRTQDRVFHDEVKREVHKMFSSGELNGYNRSLANLFGANPQPWVYHPLNADVALYDGKPMTDQVTNAPSQTAQVAAPVQPVATISTTDDGVYELDSTNRLCVPNALVRGAGWKKGDEVLVLSDPNTNEMLLTQNQTRAVSLYPVTTYVVDRDDNIRITLSALQKAGLAGLEYDIQGDGDAVTVKKIR